MIHAFNKIYQTTKFVTITRYGRDFEIEYNYVDGQLEIWSVDGNTDVEDTYSEAFLTYMEEKIDTISNMDNDEEYDNHFQNLK